MQSLAALDAEHAALRDNAGPTHSAVLCLGASFRPRVGFRAGTGLLSGDFDRPFSDGGLSETGSAHALCNAHELAIWAARHFEEKILQDRMDVWDNASEAANHPICGADDERSLRDLLLGRIKKGLMSFTYVRLCRRGATSPDSECCDLEVLRTPDSADHYSFGTSREALTPHSAPSSPGSIFLSTPPSANTSLIVEGGVSSRDTVQDADIDEWDWQPGVGTEIPSFHTIANPETLSQLVRDYVDDWAWRRRPPPAHEFIVPLPSMPDYIESEQLVAPLRAYVRAIAGPAVAVDDPLQDVGLGGYDVDA
eukprot:2505081-Amphidinium_carterae.2